MKEILEIADLITVLKDGKKVGTLLKTKQLKKTYSDDGGAAVFRSFPPRYSGGCPEEVVLKVENLSVGNSVHDVSFSVEKIKYWV